MKFKNAGNPRRADRKKKTARAIRQVETPKPPPQVESPSPKPQPLKIPPILLEGDPPPPPVSVSGLARRYEVGLPPVAPAHAPGPRFEAPPPSPPPAVNVPANRPEPISTPPPERFPPPAGLPESYGTRQLYLTARDPRMLYAHWDFSRDEMKSCNDQAADGHMMLRIYRDTPVGEPVLQIPLFPQSRDWFVPAPQAGATYLAELGYYDASRKWIGRAASGAAATPPDGLADDKGARFATILAQAPSEQSAEPVREKVGEHIPLAEVLLQLHARANGHRHPPTAAQVPGPWTPQQEEALAQLLSWMDKRQAGSVEIAELIRRQLEEEIASQSAAGRGLEGFPAEALGGISSPTEKGGRQKGFWFQVNAELVIYGATEPDAKVTIGGRRVKLSPDGRFSLRFALPDGEFVLPVAARSAGDDTRQVELNFARKSNYVGDVGTDPQDPALQPPISEAIV